MAKSNGLTLIELIIVITLIGILVLIGITYFRAQAFKGNDARRKANIRRIQVAIEEYEKDYDCYPLNLPSCSPGTNFTPYIDKIPCDPVSNASYYYEHQDSSCPSWYRLYTVLENKSDVNATQNIGPYGAFNYQTASSNAPPTTIIGSTPPPSSGGGGGGVSSGYYGCKSGSCVPIIWDPARPGPECDPNYQNTTCYSQCGPGITECIPWN